jgi:hypothetical protein
MEELEEYEWDEEDRDPYYSTGFCEYPDCLMFGNHHFASDCHNAEDLKRYYEEFKEM